MERRALSQEIRKEGGRIAKAAKQYGRMMWGSSMHSDDKCKLYAGGEEYLKGPPPHTIHNTKRYFRATWERRNQRSKQSTGRYAETMARQPNRNCMRQRQKKRNKGEPRTGCAMRYRLGVHGGNNLIKWGELDNAIAERTVCFPGMGIYPASRPRPTRKPNIRIRPSTEKIIATKRHTNRRKVREMHMGKLL